MPCERASIVHAVPMSSIFSTSFRSSVTDCTDCLQLSHGRAALEAQLAATHRAHCEEVERLQSRLAAAEAERAADAAEVARALAAAEARCAAAEREGRRATQAAEAARQVEVAALMSRYEREVELVRTEARAEAAERADAATTEAAEAASGRDLRDARGSALRGSDRGRCAQDDARVAAGGEGDGAGAARGVASRGG